MRRPDEVHKEITDEMRQDAIDALPPVDSKGAAIKLVKILKKLQLDTMAVESVDKGDWDSDVEYLTDKLHWAEVQILALLVQEVNKARVDELKMAIDMAGQSLTKDGTLLTTAGMDSGDPGRVDVNILKIRLKQLERLG